jgi:predicted outer membrane repeat protein
MEAAVMLLSFSRKNRSTVRNCSRRTSFRPRLEALEGRQVPSTVTVLNNRDSGAGSLRAEIAAAKNNDTIVFAPSLAGQTVTLTSGELLINHNVTIAGPGAGELTINGNHASRVFEVAKGANSVTVSGLTIGSGQAVVGGGILNRGTLMLSGSILAGNIAAGSIYVAGSGVGGGIENVGTLTVSGSTLAGNSATLGGGGIANGGKLTVTNSTLSANTANNDGGGINNDGTLTITGSTLSGNVTLISGGGIVNGGTLMISGSTLSGNSASESGGGIYNIGTLTVSGSSLSGNTAAYEGGGILTASGFGGNTAMVSNSTLSGNTAAYEGGGIYVTGGTLTVSGSALTGNSATSEGGGIYIGAYGTVTVKNSSSITGNTAPVGFGADIDNQGALYLDGTSIIGVLDGNLAVPI